MRSTEKLVAALTEANAPKRLINDAKADVFHDFKSPLAMPINELVARCRQHGLDAIADRAIDGEFDATKEESDEWAQSADAQEIAKELPPAMRDALGIPHAPKDEQC